MFQKLWRDENGALVSSELVLIMTILVIGMITGLESLRDAIIVEMADAGAADGDADQSYTIGSATAHSSATAGSVFRDAPDFCDGASPGGTNSRCLVIGAASALGTAEGSDIRL
jgi:Flp pilus assembly pilin Flp